MRTGQGILVRGDVHTIVQLECSRCLEPVAVAVEAHVEDEFLPSVNVLSGEPLPVPEDEALRIDDRHILDLTEAVRQYLVTTLPLQPVCRADCRGLCPTCGADLNLAACDCGTDATSGPLAALGSLLRPESAHPRTRVDDPVQ
jgi:uncharacterized protein